MNRRNVCLLMLISLLPVAAQNKPASKGGPIFTIPKTVVTLDMQIDRAVLSPGVYCEFVDLFMPGLDPAVPCNGNTLSPLTYPEGTTPAIDVKLRDMTRDARTKMLKDERDKKIVPLKKDQAKADKAVADLEGTAPGKAEADKKEQELVDAVTKTSAAAAETNKTFEEMKALGISDPKKLKKIAQAAGAKDSATYLNDLDTKNKAAKTVSDKAQKDLKDAGPDLAKLRRKLKELCAPEEDNPPAQCTDLENLRTAAADATKKMTDAVKAAARYDRRPAHSTSATRVKSYTIGARGIPDPDFVQDMTYTSGFFKDSENTFDIEESGILQGVKTNTTDHTAEFFLSILKAAAGIAGSVFTGASLPLASNAPDVEKPAETRFVEEFLKKELEASKANILVANFYALSRGRRLQYVDSWLQDKDFSVKAALLSARRRFAELAALEDKYGTLTDGSASGAGLPAAIDANRKSFGSSLADNWNGSSTVVSWMPTFEVTPARTASGSKNPDALSDGQSLILFSLATRCGVSAATSELAPVRGALPAGMTCKGGDDEDEAPKSVDLTLAVSKALGKTVASEARGLSTQPGKPGLPFVVPGEATVTLEGTGIRVRDTPAKLAQWGYVAYIPSSFFGGTGGVTATYYQATGALKNITQKSSAKATGATVDTVAGAVQSTLNAKLAADTAAQTKADAAAKAAKDEDLDKWTRLQKTLEARKAAEAICKELGITPCQ